MKCLCLLSHSYYWSLRPSCHSKCLCIHANYMPLNTVTGLSKLPNTIQIARTVTLPKFVSITSIRPNFLIKCDGNIWPRRFDDWLNPMCKSTIAPLVVYRHAEFKFVSASCRWNVNSNNNNNNIVKFFTHSQFCLFFHSHSYEEKDRDTIVFLLVEERICASVFCLCICASTIYIHIIYIMYIMRTRRSDRTKTTLNCLPFNGIFT